jgi:nitrate reductase NapE component
MKKKNILKFLFLVILLYPLFSLFSAVGDIGEVGLQEARKAISHYQVSIWVSWLVLVSASVYFKWTKQKNFFFCFTYAFLVVAFGFLGYLAQELVARYELPNKFGDAYSFGVLHALQHIISSLVLTGFLQAAVWWFTRKWHCR